MINFYKTINGKIEEISNFEENCWVNCVSAEDEDANFLLKKFDLEPEMVRATMDPEESSRIDKDDGNVLIIIDAPVVDKSGKSLTYYTVPVSIILTPNALITVCLKENSIIEEFTSGLIKKARPEDRNLFIFHILIRTAHKYLQYLGQIDKISSHIENELKKSMKNNELIQLLEIQKSLVYFSSSLKYIAVLLSRIEDGRYVTLNEEDREMLQDVTTEMRQASEMAEIYINILSQMMSAFASVISNNLNIVMKFLTSFTLILTIPSIISSIYGMNNKGFMNIINDSSSIWSTWWFPFSIIALIMAIVWYFLRKKDMI